MRSLQCLYIHHSTTSAFAGTDSPSFLCPRAARLGLATVRYKKAGGCPCYKRACCEPISNSIFPLALRELQTRAHPRSTGGSTMNLDGLAGCERGYTKPAARKNPPDARPPNVDNSRPKTPLQAASKRHRSPSRQPATRDIAAVKLPKLGSTARRDDMDTDTSPFQEPRRRSHRRRSLPQTRSDI